MLRTPDSVLSRWTRMWTQMKEELRSAARRLVPVSARRSVVRLTRWPPVGFVRFGSLRRQHPISRAWGEERGLPVDRYYIERFLQAHARDVRGRVLEVGDDTYTRSFGGDRVTRSDVLHMAEGNPRATIVGDLTRGDSIPSESFDCVILTQTLQFIYDVPAALKTLYGILKPGGVALVTIPGISKISRHDMDRWGHYWSFTSLSARRLFEAAFPAGQLRVETHGNVLSAIAFLHGLAAEDLRTEDLRHFDPEYEVLITVRAVRAE